MVHKNSGQSLTQPNEFVCAEQFWNHASCAGKLVADFVGVTRAFYLSALNIFIQRSFSAMFLHMI